MLLQRRAKAQVDSSAVFAQPEDAVLPQLPADGMIRPLPGKSGGSALQFCELTVPLETPSGFKLPIAAGSGDHYANPGMVAAGGTMLVAGVRAEQLLPPPAGGAGKDPQLLPALPALTAAIPHATTVLGAWQHGPARLIIELLPEAEGTGVDGAPVPLSELLATPAGAGAGAAPAALPLPEAIKLVSHIAGAAEGLLSCGVMIDGLSTDTCVAIPARSDRSQLTAPLDSWHVAGWTGAVVSSMLVLSSAASSSTGNRFSAGNLALRSTIGARAPRAVWDWGFSRQVAMAR